MYKFPSCETCQDMRHATRSTPGPGAVGVASASEHVPAKPPPMGDEVCLPKSCSLVSEQKDQDCTDSKDSIGLYRTGLHNTLHKFFTTHFILWVCHSHSISTCSCCPAACIPWGKFTGVTPGANASSAKSWVGYKYDWSKGRQASWWGFQLLQCQQVANELSASRLCQFKTICSSKKEHASILSISSSCNLAPFSGANAKNPSAEAAASSIHSSRGFRHRMVASAQTPRYASQHNL